MAVDQSLLDQRLQDFAQHCREQALPMTPQKRAIFAAIAAVDTHPTAQEIYQQVRKDFPNLSFATVYKNLKKFLQAELIREIDLTDGTIRYDANLDDHHHVIDLDTGNIRDIYCDERIPVPSSLDSSRLEKVSVNYYVRSSHS